MKVLLIDDHELFRDGMRYVLTKLGENTEILDVSSYEDALPVISSNQDIDLILLDLGLSGLSDTEALKALRLALPATPVVVISSNDDGNKVQEILDMGAQGYIPKSTPSEILISSLKLVLSGGIYIPPEILLRLKQKPDIQADVGSKVNDMPLTPRQHEVLKKLAHGLSNKEISRILCMAEPTVRVHVAAIFKTLDVSNRTKAVHLALQKGWLDVELE